MSSKIFLVTKPLQLLISLAIIENITSSGPISLLIVDDFFDAKNVYSALNNSKNLTRIDNIIYFENHSDAFKYLEINKYNIIFIDSDVGFKRFIQLLKLKISNPKNQLIVYEEGLGTYRNNIYKSPKKNILEIFGIGTYFGGCIFTNAIYVLSPNEYISKLGNKTPVRKICTSLLDILNKHKRLINNIFPEIDYVSSEYSNDKNTCLVYMSGWNINFDVLKPYLNENLSIFIKLHPHIKSFSDEIKNNTKNFIYVTPSLPAEVLLDHLSRNFKKVKVIHHGSSITRYIDKNNIEYINYLEIQNP